MRRLAALTLYVHACILAQAQFSAPGLKDLWDHRAHFEIEQTDIGAGHAFHNPSFVWEGEELWGYYIENYWISTIPRSGVSRVRFLPTATSALNNFTGTNVSIGGAADLAQWDGKVLDISGYPKLGYWATNLQHDIGRADSEAWSASTNLDIPGYLCHGPGETTIPAGPHVAMFELRISERKSTTNTAVHLDIFDATTQTILNSRDVLHRQFPTNGDWRLFYVNFTNEPGHALEFRTWWTGLVNTRERWVGVTDGTYPFWDDRYASFPGVLKHDGTYFLAYEGAGTQNGFFGDIGLATSTDGLTFTKFGGDVAPQPILRHETNGWEKSNIGTPSLYFKASQWHLFYHGFDGSKVRIGVAQGRSLTDLTKVGSPILDVGPPGSWDSGTVGKRSQVIKEGLYYYMSYEGSTDFPFNTANWSSGMARSLDLLTWEKFPAPVIPVTNGRFGNDGPELIQIGDYFYLYVRNYNNNTDRYRLVWN